MAGHLPTQTALGEPTFHTSSYKMWQIIYNDKQKVGSARGVTHPAGSLFCDSRVTLLALGLTFLDA